MRIDQLPVTSAAPRTASAARQLEQAFLEEMLKYCGPRAGEGGFAGGTGEEQFASFLTREYAAILSRHVGLGFGSFMPGASE